ncbi:MAG: YihY/virulence factor BrkB family protein [Planctomycetes bacterium]|nr:YihY/virulence factor BrkB family protein [Planctomycetota bacterium]
MRFAGGRTVITSIVSSYFADKVPRLAAALSYYTVFSVAPLLVIAISIAGLVLGAEAARGQISHEIQGLVGKQSAEAIEAMIEHSSKPSSSIIAASIGLLTLFFGAMGVFGELQDSLNTIWEVKAKPGAGIRGFLRSRFLSFAMVFGIGFLLLVSLLLSAGLGAVNGYLQSLWPELAHVLSVANIVVSFALVTVLFALIYKVLPDVHLRWSDVWIGAAATSALFSVGKSLIGWYLGNSAIGSTYGSVGSLVVFLIWIYFSSQAFLVGAEFTKAFARTYGSHVRPKSNARWVTDQERGQEGLPPVAPAVKPGTDDGPGHIAPV